MRGGFGVEAEHFGGEAEGVAVKRGISAVRRRSITSGGGKQARHVRRGAGASRPVGCHTRASSRETVPDVP